MVSAGGLDQPCFYDEKKNVSHGMDHNLVVAEILTLRSIKNKLKQNKSCDRVSEFECVCSSGKVDFDRNFSAQASRLFFFV